MFMCVVPLQLKSASHSNQELQHEPKAEADGMVREFKEKVVQKEQKHMCWWGACEL